jgi:Protein of unknown function (DUF2798)
MRIPPRYSPLLFALLMSLVMAFIVTGFVTWINTGMGEGYIGRWMLSFFSAWPVAMVCILLFVNKVRSLVAKLTA